MARKFVPKEEKDKFISRQLSGGNDHRYSGKVEDKGHGISVTRKLMLNAELFGTEASCNFEQIFTVPALQTLGMPLSLAYITGVVSGPTSVLLLPFVAWLVNRGSYSQRRQNAVLVFSTGLVIVGIGCLITANVLHFQDLLDYDAQKSTAFGSSPPVNLSSVPYSNSSFRGAEIVTHAISWDNETYSPTTLEGTSSRAAVLSTYSVTIPKGVIAPSWNATGSYVPFKAVLGVFGFFMLDIGFDTCNCFGKAFVISCSPRAEHTSLLSLGLIMSSTGGVSTGVLGLVDFTSLLGLDSIEGLNLTVQSSVQGVVVIIIVVSSLVITLITGHRQLQHLNEQSCNTITCNNNDKNNSNKELIPSSDDLLTRSTKTDTFENSIRSFGGAGLYFDPPPSLIEENFSSQDEDVPLLSEEDTTNMEMSGVQFLSASVSYGTLEPNVTDQDKSRYPADEEQEENEHEENHYQHGRIRNPRVKIGFIFLAAFFCNGCTVNITYSISDFIGKAVYGGEPDAAPDSDSLMRYQEGMKMAPWAFLTYYVSYLVTSIANSKIMAFLGYRVEYVLAHVLTVAAMLIVTLTVRLEAVFMLSIIAGFLRTCQYVIPYAVANDIAQSMVKAGSSRSVVGLVMSVVGIGIPMGYCLLFGWIGAVEELTGDSRVPMFFGCVFGCLAFTSFLCVGKV